MTEDDGFETVHPALPTVRELVDAWDRRVGPRDRRVGIPAFDEVDRQALATMLREAYHSENGWYDMADLVCEWVTARLRGNP